MFDIFTKAKITLTAENFHAPLRADRLDSAWLVYRAITKALSAMECERQILEGHSKAAEVTSGIDTLVVDKSGLDQFVDENCLDQKPTDASYRNLLGKRMSEQNQRTERLDRDIACYKLLQTSLLTEFPELGSQHCARDRESVIKSQRLTMAKS